MNNNEMQLDVGALVQVQQKKIERLVTENVMLEARLLQSETELNKFLQVDDEPINYEVKDIPKKESAD
jgi:hypothetical protein